MFLDNQMVSEDHDLSEKKQQVNHRQASVSVASDQNSTGQLTIVQI